MELYRVANSFSAFSVTSGEVLDLWSDSGANLGLGRLGSCLGR